MFKIGFGIKLLNDRDLLLTANLELLHFGGGTRGQSTLYAPSDIYLYVIDQASIAQNDTSYYACEVIELSTIPVYAGNNPKFSLWGDDYKRQELIKNSRACIYYYHDKSNIRFFLHVKYRESVIDCEMNPKELQLLKYYWFTSPLSYRRSLKFGEDTYNQILSTDVTSIIDSIRIVTGEKTFYGRDSESTHFAERLIVSTNDFYIISSLCIESDNKYHRSPFGHTTFMYGPENSETFRIFSYDSIVREAKINCLESLIDQNTMDFNVKDSIKYILLRSRLLNFRPSHTLSIQSCTLDYEGINSEKTEYLKESLKKTYNLGRHLSALIYINQEAIKAPQNIIDEVISSYSEWKVDQIRNSGLRHLTIYQSAKDICREFNLRSNERFNFRIDFSHFPSYTSKSTLKSDLSDFDWDAYEKA